jgi:hypothetical protein
MSDLSQVIVVTLFAAVALGALLRPYISRPAKKASTSTDAGCPGCGTCDDAPAATSNRR